MGHQFGARHTYNGSACAGPPTRSTAYEPGSGTTIMAYTGICRSYNIQDGGDPYFHTASYEQILNFSIYSAGCAKIINTVNSAPTVDAGEGGFVIPVNTPFTLTGSGSDPDRDELTYSWEQFDLGPPGPPGAPVRNAPLFRAFPPKATPSRTFPDISDIINNRQTLGELLPSYTRDLTFRLTARDGGGGVNYDQMSFKVTGRAGPFHVSSFNTAGTIVAQSNVTIHWDVANTNGSEVNCRLVNILLSGDGGLTYPHTLAGSVVNNGSATVLIPDMITSNGRFKVEAADNIFFDINDMDFNIVATPVPDFYINLSERFLSMDCALSTVQVDVNIGSILDFSDNVNLSVDGLGDHLTASFSVNPVMPGSSSSLTINGTGLGVGGLHTLTVNATAGATTHSQNLALDVYSDVVEVLSPANGMTEVALFATINWSGIGGDGTYDLDIATDAGFSNIVISKWGLMSTVHRTTALSESTRYFLRIKGTSNCGTTNYASVEFTTGASVSLCRTYISSDTPVIISDTGSPVITSEVMVPEVGVVSDVNILHLKGTHSFVSDLTFSLRSPEGTSILLIEGICAGGAKHFNLGLDDEAGTGAIPCPPTDGRVYSPKERLSVFNGEESTGAWKLIVQDNSNRDGGQLTQWALEICADYSGLPESPSELSLVEVSNTQINLFWRDNSTNEDAFIVERSTSDNSNYAEIATLGAGSTSYEDINIAPEVYFYRIKAMNSGGDSDYSNEVSGSLVLDTPLQAGTEIVIHPNPGAGLFNLVLPQNMSNLKLSLYDITGNKIDPVISKKDGNISINLISYANGIYLLKVTSLSGSHIIRIIKNY